MRNKESIRKLLFLFVCFFVVAAFCISSLYTIEFTEHHCTGEHCPICIHLNLISAVFKNDILLGSPALFNFFPVFIFLITLIFNKFFICLATLIEQKIRMNN